MNNNKLPQVTFIYNRYKNATKDKPAVVELRITYNYKQKYISTGIMLYPHQWKDGKIVNCPDLIKISKVLDKLLTDVKQILYTMMEEGEIDIFSVSERLEKLHTKTIGFLEFCNQRAEVRKYGRERIVRRDITDS